MRKIAELSRDEGLDVLVEITPYVRSLATTEALLKEMKAWHTMSAEDRMEPTFVPDMVARLVPLWCRECRADLMAIVKILGGYSDDDLDGMNAVCAFEEMASVFNDPDFVNFFTSFVVMKPAE